VPIACRHCGARGTTDRAAAAAADDDDDTNAGTTLSGLAHCTIASRHVPNDVVLYNE